jgi:hypothetical protein
MSPDFSDVDQGLRLTRGDKIAEELGGDKVAEESHELKSTRAHTDELTIQEVRYRIASLKNHTEGGLENFKPQA